MITLKSKTEKVLFALVIVLTITLIANIFIGKSAELVSAEESSESSKDESSDSSEENSGDSQSSENDESSVIENKTEAPKKNITPTSSNQKLPIIVDPNVSSEQDMDLETSEESSLESEPEESSEKPEMSKKSIEGFDDVVSINGNIAIVKKQQKILGIFNTYIKSEVTLDEAGNVIDEKKNFFNWLLDFFSF